MYMYTMYVYNSNSNIIILTINSVMFPIVLFDRLNISIVSPVYALGKHRSAA